MDPLESDLEHDQLPSVEEYKTTVAQISKGGVFSRLDPESGSSQTYKRLDPDAAVASEGVYGSSFEVAADTEDIEFYKDTTVEERKGLSSLKILCFSFVFSGLRRIGQHGKRNRSHGPRSFSRAPHPPWRPS